MQKIKSKCQRAVSRLGNSAFARKGMLAMGAVMLTVSDMMAASKGAAGFTKATQEVSSYQTPVSNLMKAIAAVIVLRRDATVKVLDIIVPIMAGFYFLLTLIKMQNGDQDVKRTIMLTIGGCIAFIALSEALPLFFK